MFHQLNAAIKCVNLVTGVVSLYAGTGVAGSTGTQGVATSMKIFLPLGLFVDQFDNLYFADGSPTSTNPSNVGRVIYSGIPIKKNGLKGDMTIVAGSGLATTGNNVYATSPQAGIYYPYGTCIDGKYFIPRTSCHVSYTLSPTLFIFIILPFLLSTGSGNIYIVAGLTTPVVQKVSASTSVLTVIAGMKPSPHATPSTPQNTKP